MYVRVLSSSECLMLQVQSLIHINSMKTKYRHATADRYRPGYKHIFREVYKLYNEYSKQSLRIPLSRHDVHPFHRLAPCGASFGCTDITHRLQSLPC